VVVLHVVFEYVNSHLRTEWPVFLFFGFLLYRLIRWHFHWRVREETRDLIARLEREVLAMQSGEEGEGWCEPDASPLGAADLVPIAASGPS
jgi:hypothetical protein